jgi:hypothetical protein
VKQSVVDREVVAVVDAGEMVSIAVSNKLHAVTRRETNVSILEPHPL